MALPDFLPSSDMEIYALAITIIKGVYIKMALIKDRFYGSLAGLVVGDALGTTVEFSSPGTFEPVTDIVGGGVFGLKPGQWTDDTSMALCLAESMVQKIALIQRTKCVATPIGITWDI